MVDALIRFLIAIVIVAACYFLTIWVLGIVGIVIPIMVERCLGALAVLIVILYAWRTFGGSLTAGPWFGPPRPPGT